MLSCLLCDAKFRIFEAHLKLSTLYSEAPIMRPSSYFHENLDLASSSDTKEASTSHSQVVVIHNLVHELGSVADSDRDCMHYLEGLLQNSSL